MKSLVRPALVAAFVLVLAVPAAEAKSASISGTVAAAPAGGSVPVLISQASQKRLRSQSPVARVKLPKTLPFAGRTLKTNQVRAGDLISGKVRVPKKTKSGILPALKLSRAKVTARESALSNDELLGYVFGLAAQIGSLQANIATLQGTIAALQSRLLELQTAAAQGSAGLQSSIDKIIADIAALQGVATGLNTTVANLGTQLNSLSGTVCDPPSPLALLC